MTTIFFHPSILFLFLDPRSGMGKNKDPGSGMNIPDPQHWLQIPITLMRSRIRIHKKLGLTTLEERAQDRHDPGLLMEKDMVKSAHITMCRGVQ
jgi:hypothetical protein